MGITEKQVLRFSIGIAMIVVLVLFGIFIPLSSHAQSNDVTVEEIHNLLESIESANARNQNETMIMISNFNQTSTRLFENLLSILTVNQDASNLTNTTLKEIENLLKKNQLRSEDTQLANSLIQVSGIFIAIIGGFLTTKILSLGTERNRIRRKLSEIESDISHSNSIIKQYRGISDDLKKRGSREHERYENVDKQLKIEESKVSHLEDQTSILEDDLTDLQNPNIWKSGVIFLSLAVFSGIIFPSVQQFFELGNPSLTALVGFLIVFILFLFYLVIEFRRTLKIIKIDM